MLLELSFRHAGAGGLFCLCANRVPNGGTYHKVLIREAIAVVREGREVKQSYSVSVSSTMEEEEEEVKSRLRRPTREITVVARSKRGRHARDHWGLAASFSRDETVSTFT